MGPDDSISVDEEMANTNHFGNRAQPSAGRHLYIYLAVLLFAGAVYLGCIVSPPSLMDDVDAVQAQIARTMLTSGDWVTARLDGVPYLEKSPLIYWTIALSYEIFGVHDWAARIPVALSAMGPRIALAISDDLFTWKRLGMLGYESNHDVDFGQYGNKDGMLFPATVLDPEGKPALAILHRPTYLIHRDDGTVTLQIPAEVKEERESIWIGYMSLERAREDIRNLVQVYGNTLVAVPEFAWESLKIGGGTPPVRIPQGWLTFYHGVSGFYSLNPALPKHVVYTAGALVLDAQDPRKTIYRSPEPVLQPDEHGEQHGIVPNVVFPTAVDLRDHERLDVYYGMADSRIGVATTSVPEQLPIE